MHNNLGSLCQFLTTPKYEFVSITPSVRATERLERTPRVKKIAENKQKSLVIIPKLRIDKGKYMKKKERLKVYSTSPLGVYEKVHEELM